MCVRPSADGLNRRATPELSPGAQLSGARVIVTERVGWSPLGRYPRLRHLQDDDGLFLGKTGVVLADRVHCPGFFRTHHAVGRRDADICEPSFRVASA
jgi:hypothetical protein